MTLYCSDTLQALFCDNGHWGYESVHNMPSVLLNTQVFDVAVNERSSGLWIEPSITVQSYSITPETSNSKLTGAQYNALLIDLALSN